MQETRRARRDIGVVGCSVRADGPARVGTHINNARAISRVIDGVSSIMVSEEQRQRQQQRPRAERAMLARALSAGLDEGERRGPARELTRDENRRTHADEMG